LDASQPVHLANLKSSGVVAAEEEIAGAGASRYNVYDVRSVV
jgi:hypothetical protein